MTDDLEQIGLTAVDRFLETFNSRDKHAWSDSLNFPHVRPSPFGRIAVAESREQYVAAVDYERIIASGWDHSEWDYKRVLHTAPDKIHVAGQWSRFDLAGKKILTTPIVYIVTRNAQQWGIQSRFACDDAGDEDTTGLQIEAFELLDSYIEACNEQRGRDSAALLNYPHYGIGAGKLNILKSSDEFELDQEHIELQAIMAIQTGQQSINLGIELTLAAGDQSRALQAVINLTRRDEHLGIQAWSFIQTDSG